MVKVLLEKEVKHKEVAVDNHIDDDEKYFIEGFELGNDNK